MGASAISKKSGTKPVQITVIRSPPIQPPQPAKPTVLRLAPFAPLAIKEDDKEETDPNDPLLTENIRTNARRRKIVWQASTPEPCAKVHYVNIAYAASISPSSQGSLKSVGLSPSTTPSPEGPAIGSFSDATKRRTNSKSMYDFSHLLESDRLTPNNKASAQPGTLLTRYRLNVPKQTLLPTPEPAPEEEFSQCVVTVRARSKGSEERVAFRSSEGLYRKSRPL